MPLGLAVLLVVSDGVPLGVALWVADGVPLLVVEGVGLAVKDAVPLLDGVGLPVGLALGEAVALVVDVGVWVGVAVGVSEGNPRHPLPPPSTIQFEKHKYHHKISKLPSSRHVA